MGDLKRKQVSIVIFILYRLILDWSYVFLVSDVFSYSGFILDVGYFNYTSSWLLFFIIILLTPIETNKASNYFFMSASVFLLAPLSSLYGLTNWSVFPIALSMFAVFFIYIVVSIDIKLNIKPVFFRDGKKISLAVSVFFIIILIAWYFISGAVRYFNLDLTKVYDYRQASSELANIGIMAYINNWTFKVFIFYAFSWLLLNKKYSLVTILFCVQVFFFGVSSHKSVLFSPLIILSIWWYFSRFKTLLIIPVGIVVVVALSLITFVLFNDILTSSMFIRRLLFVPAKLTYDYINFFSVNDFIYWSNSVLSVFLSYKYYLPLGALIGDYGGAGASANNGFISSGYAHAGLFGVFLYSLIIAVLLRLLNYAVTKGVPLWFALALVIIPLRDTMISSDLFTTLLTHGLLVAFVLLFLSIEKNKKGL